MEGSQDPKPSSPRKTNLTRSLIGSQQKSVYNSSVRPNKMKLRHAASFQFTQLDPEEEHVNPCNAYKI